jgi:hypothetical protein
VRGGEDGGAAGQGEERLAEALAEEPAVGLGEEALGDLVALFVHAVGREGVAPDGHAVGHVVDRAGEERRAAHEHERADDHEGEPRRGHVEQRQEAAEEHERRPQVADEHEHEHGGAPDHEQRPDVLEGEPAAEPAGHELPGVVEVAREEDDDRELGELGGLEGDGTDAHGEVRPVHRLAEHGQPRHEEQRDAGGRDRVAVALQHAEVAQEQHGRAEEPEADGEPLRLLARQVGLDAVDHHEADRTQQRRQREEVGVRVREPRADEEVREEAPREEERAVDERHVAHLLLPGEEHGGEPRGHEEGDGDEPEELAQAGGAGHGMRPCSSWARRSEASSRERSSWSRMRARRAAEMERAGTLVTVTSS